MAEQQFELSNHSGYATSYARYQQLQHELLAAEAGYEDLRTRQPEQTTLQTRAKAVLAGADASAPMPDAMEGWRKSLTVALERVRVLREAMALAKQSVLEEEYNASAEVCKTLAGEYKALVQRMASKLVELGRLAQEEIAFREKLRDNGIHYSAYLTPMPFTWVGDPRERDARISYWLREALRLGYLRRRLFLTHG
jgi:hypothetical protein